MALPAESYIHLVFHVSQLELFTPNYNPVSTELPKLVDLSAQDLTPKINIGKQLVKKEGQAIPQSQMDRPAGDVCNLGGLLCTSEEIYSGNYSRTSTHDEGDRRPGTHDEGDRRSASNGVQFNPPTLQSKVKLPGSC